MSKKAMWAEVLIFLLFIFGFFIANLVSPDRVKSEQENRYLQTLPEFTFERLFDKTFTKEFEDYTTDQFVLRDEWITLKAASELAVGKESNNGVSYGKGQTLIEPFTKPEKSDLDANVGYLNQLVKTLTQTCILPCCLRRARSGLTGCRRARRTTARPRSLNTATASPTPIMWMCSRL